MSSKVVKAVVPFTQLGCWVVGGAANPDNIKPRDWDLIAPFEIWDLVAPIIPANAVPNSFGGWKFIVDGIEIDLWPGSLAKFLANPHSQFIWHPLSGRRFQLL